VIYGDSITLERAQQILSRLKLQGFASTNVVFGIGSYTYQYVSRDTFGFAMKATYGVINGAPVDIFKNPRTDNGIKKSAKGLLRVNKDLTLSQQVTKEEEKEGLLQTVFLDGKLMRTESLAEIRARLAGKNSV
jgi:nicotinamide phosphoribosyltransferase